MLRSRDPEKTNPVKLPAADASMSAVFGPQLVMELRAFFLECYDVGQVLEIAKTQKYLFTSSHVMPIYHYNQVSPRLDNSPRLPGCCRQ